MIINVKKISLLQLKMKIILLLLVLCWLAKPAIIGSTIYTLSRLFQYKISFSSKNQNIIEYATITPTKDGCEGKKCFYGWISNYTTGNATYTFNNRQVQNNPIFHITLFGNSTFTIIRNASLDSKTESLLNITAQLITPLFPLFSNLVENNNSLLYEFFPFDNFTSNLANPNRFDLQKTNFSAIVANMQINSASIGWNINPTTGDLILFDDRLNSLVGRQIVGAVKVDIQLINMYIFQGQAAFSSIISQIRNTPANVANIQIDKNTILPEKEIANLFL